MVYDILTDWERDLEARTITEEDFWINVKNRLPEIPEGHRSVSVIVATFDKTYEEINPGKGYDVSEGLYHEITDHMRTKWDYPKELTADFVDLYYCGDGYSFFGPTGDPVTHWMPMPPAPGPVAQRTEILSGVKDDKNRTR